MTDMLVILRDLPPVNKEMLYLREDHQILVRRPIAPEKHIVVDWVDQQFGKGWASEVGVAFAHTPVTCFVAQQNKEILGFAGYELSAKSFFGPTGVLRDYQGMGLGKVLLIKCLEALREMGYAYAIIGGVGPVAFYEKTVGAKVIEGSGNSIYADILKRKK